MRHSIIKLVTATLACSLFFTQVALSAQAPSKNTSSTATAAEGSSSKQAEQELVIRAIGVEGLKHVNSQVVLALVKKTMVGEKLNPEKIREDLQAIVDSGYFSDVEAKLYPEGDGVKVVFVPVENEVVKSFIIDTSVLEPAIIRQYFAQKDGEVLNYKQLKADIDSFQDRIIADHGFVVSLANVDLVDGEMIVKVVPITIAALVIKGNEKTKENVIRREFAVKPGDNLNMQRLSRDVQRIMHLGFFDDVQTMFEQASTPDEINVVIEVTERKTGMATFGAGYSTVDGLLGYIEYSDDNFIGRGERVSVRTELGQKKTSYDLGFYEPYLFGSKTTFGINLYNRNYDRVKPDSDIQYKEHRQGGDLSVGRPMGEYTNGQITLKIEDTNNVPKPPSTMPEENTRTRSVIFQTNTDTTDHPFYPLRGMRANASVELAGKFLGGDTQFVKYVGETSRYIKVGSADQVLAFRLVGGMAQTPGVLPSQEEFRIGGAETVRGYKYGEMHGDRMLYMNSEYRFKIAKSLQAALFADAGQAWKGTAGSVPRLKIGYGAGLRLDTPLGILRLDYGIGEKGGSTFFSIGPSF